MNIDEKKKQLYVLYAEWEKAAQAYVESAACRAGCADCCTNVGFVDAVTLEGLIILDHMRNLPEASRKSFEEKLKRNRKEKSRSQYARCAFLMDDNTCGIYSVRPFSCRRLYSVKTCGPTGPMIHRKQWELSGQIVTAIQRLDDTGYSGHISHILTLLKDAKFRKTYLAGGFSPQDIRTFAQTHGISINRFEVEKNTNRIT